jgi:hypothetical protein
MRAGTGQDVSDSDAVGAPATYLDRGLDRTELPRQTGTEPDQEATSLSWT